MEFQVLKSSITLFFFLSAAVTALGLAAPPRSASRTTTPYIRKACKPTPHPRLCETALSFYTSKARPTQQDLCRAALISAVKAAQNATATISSFRRQKRPPLSPYEAEVTADCIENLRDSVDDLRKAANGFKSLKGSDDAEFVMSSIKTWTSAAETDVVTCTDGLDGGRKVSSRVKSAVKKSVVDVRRQISNSLSLVNGIKFKSKPSLKRA